MLIRRTSVFILFAALATAPAYAAPSPETPRWDEVAPGVWKAVIGTPEDLTLLGAAGIVPKKEALAAMPSAPFPLAAGEIETRVSGAKVALRFPLALDEEIYGLGVDFKSFRRIGSAFQLHVDHWSGQTGRTHAPVPLYISTRGYGVLIDSARYLDVYVGQAVRLAAKVKPPIIDRTTRRSEWTATPRSDSVEVGVPAPGVQVFVFAGPTPMDAVRRYNLYSGGGALPPKWGLGFLTRTPTAYTAEQVIAEVDEFRKQGIPLDMVGLEPGWHDHAYPCSFEWDNTRFPDPAGFLAEMKKRNVRVNLWFNPYVSPTAPLYQRLLPYAGSHLVWNGIVPDYTIPAAREVFIDHLRKSVVLDPWTVGGFKIDEVDGGDRRMWPDHAVFPSGHDGEQLRQTYGLLVQKMILDLYRSTNRRTMGQVRGTNAGASALPFSIYNDNYAYDEYITAVGNSGFAGVLWSPEVRGGKGEELVRRTQAVCFSPLALYNGWAVSTKLWTDPEVAGHVRSAIELRLRLLPYWYTAFAQYHYQGTPVVRPLPLLPGFRGPRPVDPAGEVDLNTNPYAVVSIPEVKDQYMIGDALLVAPIAPGASKRKVVLPAGRWYDFHTGRFAGADETIEVSPALSETPLFVRDGAIVPMIAPRQRTPGPNEVLSLEARHYGEAPGTTSVYDDDGETFDHEKGAYTWTELKVERDGKGRWRGIVRPDKKAPRWRYSHVKWVFMTPDEPAPRAGR
jgi:alpha-glucosidase (family GH31 glycosyl hydrolase)